jgi:diguanylate cyclase (GGDEF)-like protein
MGAMELMLWRWSTMVQATSAVLIAGFFIALAHSMRREELRAWVGAWIANLLALLVTIVFWLLQPEGRIAFSVAAAFYLFAKSMFVVLLVDGAAGFSVKRPARASYTGIAAVVAMLSLAVGVLTRNIDQLGFIQAAVIAICLGASAISLARANSHRYGWLALGFGLRAILGLIESAAYATHWLGDKGHAPTHLQTFISVHSSFDTGAEWVIALGCVLTLYSAIQRELTESNDELRLAQVQLGDLLHRDQLTGVLNRRSLPTRLEEARENGATILFFDLDDFKQINDVRGHHAGDACLRLFARAVKDVFGSDDRVIRFAGDEFIVITDELDPTTISSRISMIRQRLEARPPGSPEVRFSVGMSVLQRHGDPESALLEADRAMYLAKASRCP